MAGRRWIGNGFGLTDFSRGRTTQPRDIVSGGAALPFSSDPRSDVPDRSCLPCPAPCRHPAWAAERPGRGAIDAAAGHGPDL